MVPRILSLPNDLPGVNLAISLHAPTQELRSQIVPTSRAYPLHKLMAASIFYQKTRYQCFVGLPFDMQAQLPIIQVILGHTDVCSGLFSMHFFSLLPGLVLSLT